MQRRSFLTGLIFAPFAGLLSKLSWGKTTPVEDFMGPIPASSLTTFGTITKTEQQTQMLGQLLKTPAGRQMLASSLGPSLRRRRDFNSLCRRAFKVQNTHVVRSLNHLDLYVVDSEGGDIIKSDNPALGCGRRAELPTFSVVSNPMIPISQIHEKRFDLVARCLNLAKAEIGGCEDTYMFALADAAAEKANAGNYGNPDIQFDEEFEFLKAVKKQFKKQGIKDINYLFVNPRDYADLMNNLAWLSDYTYETQRNNLKRGLLGYYEIDEQKPVPVVQSRRVPLGFMYITGSSPATEKGRADLSMEKFDNAVHTGYVIDLIPLNVQTADRPDLEQIGFSLKQEIGMALNPIAIQRIKI